MRTRLRRLAPVVLSLAALPIATFAQQQAFTTDASSSGAPFSPGVKGQPIPAVTIDRPEYSVGVSKALELSRGSSLRGVAGGLEADTFNWKTRNNSARAGTLDYLRHSRDNNSNLYITANIRGLVEPDPNSPGNQRFYDTSIETLAGLAADWVRYTNHIVQTYRQGHVITDARDKAVLDSLVWNSATPGDNFDKLLAVGEAAVPKVQYWEIGNEPRVGLASTYRVTNSYTFFAPPRLADDTHKTDYRERYAALTSAMRAEDPTIKVGPALQWLNAVTEQELVDSILVRQPDGKFLPVDFLAYHPYQRLNEQTTPAGQEAFLRGVYDDHLSKVTNIRNRVAAAGRDPRSVALVASEHNVSNHTSNDTVAEMTMAHALGNTETLFSFARLGVQDAHYWIWPAHRWDGTEYPVFLAGEKLRDHMGDTLLSVAASNADNLHLYTTRDTKSGEIALWGLNFDDDTATTRATPINNVGGRGRVTLSVLGALSGATSLASANLSSEAGGPTHAVDWTTVDLTGTRLDTLQLNFPSATITLLTIEPWRQVALPGDVNQDGRVNSNDLGVINAAANQNEKNWWQGDVTGDGVVNSADVAIFNANNGAQTGTRWTAQAGTWTTAANWQGGVVPNAVNANAYLAGSITAARNITANSQVTLGTLVFDNANAYDVVGSGGLRLQAALNGSGTARVYVVQGQQKISLPLVLTSSTTVDVAAGASLRTGNAALAAGRTLRKTGNGTLTITGTQTHAAGTALMVDGGTLDLNTNVAASGAANVTLNANAAVNLNARQNLAALNVGAGALVVAGAGGANVINTRTLAIASTGKLDLTNNRMVVTDGVKGVFAGGAYTDITGVIASGRDHGAWDGYGIVTSMPDAARGLTTIAVADAAETVHAGGTFAGVSVAAGDVLLMYTYAGDANLDGQIDAGDYGVIDNFVQLAGSFGYARGDFNYDGFIDAGDYGVIDNNVQGQGSPILTSGPAGQAVAVPEPAPVAGVVVAALGLFHARRRA
jgi:hypothetical protein